MKRQLLVAGVLVAAVLVVIQNWIYFRETSEASRSRGVRQAEQVASTEQVEETSGSKLRFGHLGLHRAFSAAKFIRRHFPPPCRPAGRRWRATELAPGRGQIRARCVE